MKQVFFSLILGLCLAMSVYAETPRNTSGAGGNKPGSLAEELFLLTGSNEPAKRPLSIIGGETKEIKYLAPDGGYYPAGTTLTDPTGKSVFIGRNGLIVESGPNQKPVTNLISVDANGNIVIKEAPTNQAPVIKTPTEINILNDIVNPNGDLGIGKGSIFDNPLNKLLNQLFYIGLIAAVILAIVMIIRGGIEYMTIDAIASKENGKKRVQAALGGLVLAFSAILILNTINPGLTSLKITFEELKRIASITVDGGLTSGTRTGTWNGEPMTGEIASKFTDKELEAYTLQKIKELGFSNLNPADKAAFFPNGGTDEEWLALASAMIKYESGFNPSTTFPEKNKDGTPRLNGKGEQIISTGLFQVSEESIRGYGFNYTTEQLKDPRINLEVGLGILKQRIEKDGYISGQNNSGGAAYWSVLRTTGKLEDVKNEMRK